MNETSIEKTGSKAMYVKPCMKKYPPIKVSTGYTYYYYYYTYSYYYWS